MSTLRWPALVAAGAALLLSAGCSAAKATSTVPSPRPTATHAAATEPGQAVLRARLAAVRRHARSVRVSGVWTGEGQAVTLAMGLTRPGDMSGTMTLHAARVRVLTLDGLAYVKATTGMLKYDPSLAAVCALLCGKWIQAPSEMRSGMASAAWPALVDPVLRIAARGRLTREGPATIAGQAAWKLGVRGGTLYVPQQGPAYPLAWSRGRDSYLFSDWNRVRIPALPPASQVVNISQLGL